MIFILTGLLNVSEWIYEKTQRRSAKNLTGENFMKKRKLAQTVLSVLLCAMIIFSLYGCEINKLPYNIKVLRNGYEYRIYEEFYSKHQTFGVITRQEIIDDNGNKKTIEVRNSEAPQQILTILNNTEGVNDAFSFVNFEVDFNTEMIVMLFFSDYSRGDCYVRYANIEGTIMYLTFSREIPKGTATGIQPGVQNCLVMKMNKCELTDIYLTK